MRCQACGAWTPIRRRCCFSCGARLSWRALCRQLFTSETGDDGNPRPRPPELASPRSRLAAAGIDIILGIVALSFVGGFGHDHAFHGGAPPLRIVIIAWLAVLAFPAFLEGPTGQTIGKRMTGIRVVMEKTGAPPGFRTAAHRTGARAIFGWISFLALTDPLLRTLHDRSAETVVVKVPRSVGSHEAPSAVASDAGDR